MKQKILKLFLINLLLLVVGVYTIDFLTNVFLRTIFNAIFGAEVGIYIGNLFVYVAIPGIITFYTCLTNARDEEKRRAYLKTIEGELYEGNKDIRAIIKDKEYWAQCAMCAILFMILFVIAMTGIGPIWVIPVCIPLFAVISLLWQMHLHKVWANERIRVERSDNVD